MSASTKVRHRRAAVSAVSLALCAMPLAAAPVASAHGDGSINGRYRVTSNGDWAMTDEVYHDQAIVQSTWTISSTCISPTECAGTVSSDQGWTVDVSQRSGQWFVRRLVPGWQPCPDGGAADGFQTFRFYEADPFTGQRPTTSSNIYLGDDTTKSASGSCGRNEPLVVSMPFKMVPA